MQKKSSKLLYNYWNELRGSRSAPERKDIDPVKIRTSLANVFILETDIENEDYLFRLAGSHICSTYCRELKGHSFFELWQDKDQEALKTLISAVTQDHGVALATFQGTTKQGKKAFFEVILLPIRHNGSTVTRILGGLSAIDQPYWLGTEAILEQRISGLRLIWPDDPYMQSDSYLQKPFSDLPNQVATKQNDVDWQKSPSTYESFENNEVTAIPVKIHGNVARRYSHLSVIDGGKS